MRPIITLLSVSAGFLLMTTFISCEKDDNSTPNTTIQASIEDNVQKGQWRITKFEDSGKDETSKFNGYDFTFNVSGVLNASNTTNSFDGSWNITDSNYDDDSQDDLDFNIYFGYGNDFDELSDDWDIISQSSTKIELIDVSGGNGGTDYLTFEKI